MTAPDGGERYQHWDACDDCGFEGLMLYCHRVDEDYSDEDVLGFMMDSSCPACGQEAAVLVVVEQYQEMMRLSKRGRVE